MHLFCVCLQKKIVRHRAALGQKNTTKCQNKCPPSHLYLLSPAGAEEHKIVSQITLINFCFCHVLFSRGLNAFWYVNLYSFFFGGEKGAKHTIFINPHSIREYIVKVHFRVKVKTTEVYYKNGATKRRWNKRSPFPVKRNISGSTNFFVGKISTFFPSLNCKGRLHAIWRNKKRP